MAIVKGIKEGIPWLKCSSLFERLSLHHLCGRRSGDTGGNGMVAYWWRAQLVCAPLSRCSVQSEATGLNTRPVLGEFYPTSHHILPYILQLQCFLFGSLLSSLDYIQLAEVKCSPACSMYFFTHTHPH